MPSKQDKYDRIFSACVRERDDHTCQLQISKDCRGTDRYSMACCHFVGRIRHSTRWEPDNCITGCGPCHYEMDNSPLQKAVLMRKFLGDTRAEEIERQGRQIAKWTKAEKEEMYRHYRNELNRLQDLRSSGESGPLRLVGYQ